MRCFWVVAGLALMMGAGPARADLAAGLEAYARGDHAQAKREFEPLARDGDTSAQFNLGQMYRQGQGVRRDLGLAAHWYRAAAVQGLPRAQFNLGVMYEKGMGVDKSLVLAAQWFQQAAENGYPNAAEALAELRDERSEIGAQLRRQRVAALISANRGDPQAQYQLGLAYALGVGGARDLRSAVNWLRRAAMNGVTGAQIQLGVMLANGQGIALDLVEAGAWLLLGAAEGDARAAQNLSALRSRMSPTQRESADARSRALAAEIERSRPG